ncbi:MAG: orotate phosphoribosyltransferase-like protein [Methanobacteriota archaeon]|nr:MAG: orotate phosphoribosyltransferase-like protein [Euryarchaeota archaeon]
MTRGVKGGEPPKDVKIGWRSVGVFGNRIGFMAAAMSDIALEELEKRQMDADSIVGIAINGIPLAALMSEELERELIIYRPSQERHGKGGAFSSNYASPQGKKVLIVDDVVSTGDTIKATISDVHDAGGTVVLAVVLVNKTAQDEIAGVPLRALIRARSI